jgi:hypothetical protein
MLMIQYQQHFHKNISFCSKATNNTDSYFFKHLFVEKVFIPKKINLFYKNKFVPFL